MMYTCQMRQQWTQMLGITGHRTTYNTEQYTHQIVRPRNNIWINEIGKSNGLIYVTVINGKKYFMQQQTAPTDK